MNFNKKVMIRVEVFESIHIIFTFFSFLYFMFRHITYMEPRSEYFLESTVPND